MTGQRSFIAALVCASLLAAHGARADDQSSEAAPAADSKIYQHIGYGTCSANNCIVTFKKVPAGKALQTTNLSCQAESGANGVPATSATLATDMTLTFMPLTPYQFNSTYAISTGALSGSVFVGNKRAPKVTINNAVDAQCTLSGRLIAE